MIWLYIRSNVYPAIHLYIYISVDSVWIGLYTYLSINVAPNQTLSALLSLIILKGRIEAVRQIPAVWSIFRAQQTQKIRYQAGNGPA